MIGIYKITSPTNKIYIGQSVNIDRRFNKYKRLDCKYQIRLYNSFKKHGVDNHKFEIVVQCSIGLLNYFERIWQDYYDVSSKKGLNCMLTKTNDRSGKYSDVVRKKMSDVKKGKPKSEEHKLKIGLAHKGKYRSEESKLNMKGRIVSYETRIKISEGNIGKTITEETRKKMSDSAKGNKKRLGFKHSEETKLKLRKPRTEETKIKMSKARKGNKYSGIKNNK